MTFKDFYLLKPGDVVLLKRPFRDESEIELVSFDKDTSDSRRLSFIVRYNSLICCFIVTLRGVYFEFFRAGETFKTNSFSLTTLTKKASQ